MNMETASPALAADDDRLLSPNEFLGRTGLGRTKAWEMRRDGLLRYVRLSPRKIAYPCPELRRLVAERSEGGHALEAACLLPTGEASCG